MQKLVLIVFLFPIFIVAQNQKKQVVKKAIYKGDTVFYDELPAVPVGAGSDDFWKNYHHAKTFVPKVYYYAILVKELSNKYDQEMEHMDSKRAKKKYIKKAKKNIKKEFGDDIREMSVTRSFYMIKLIERETDKMAYTLLAEYLGKTKAQLWQGISRLGGADLKRHYDPQNDDGYIELVVREIESGTLTYEDHTPKIVDGREVMSKRKKRIKKEKKKD